MATRTDKLAMSAPSSSSISVPDGAHDSPGSSNTGSPFDRPLDSNDPLSFFLGSVVGDHTESTGDSSADDSVSSATPPSHDSPAADWASSDPGPSKELGGIWPQPDLSLFSLDSFNASSNVDFSLGFDPMLSPNDPLDSMHPAGSVGIGPSVGDFSPFNFGAEYAANSAASDAALKSDFTSPMSGSSFPTTAGQTQEAPGSSTSSNQLPALGQECSPNDQLMDELARRARQLVGLTMALPFDENIQSAPDSQLSQHHRRQAQQSVPLGSDFSATSTPVSGARTSSSSPGSTPPPISTRTKTSHTTIERRYRTNLNARIQSLRAAVPALRVLEVKQGNRVGNLALKAGTRRVGVDPDAQPGQEDVIDERGYIDGVKVARKGSKANVLGKAVEYIHVLKRREMRLKREQEGLKALMRSLVGGSELVQQWEKMWRERFGGSEKDEIDADEAEADDENDDGEDYDGVEEKEPDEMGGTAGKKRKRAKLDALASAKSKETKVAQSESLNYFQTTQPIPIMPSLSNSTSIPSTIPMQPEKRKRGRPRKIPIPSIATSTVAVPDALEGPFGSNFFQQQPSTTTAKEIKMEVDSAAMAQGLQTMSPSGQHSGHQYLMAAFAFFSFFNSPISYSSGQEWQASRSATHSGSVLGDTSAEVLMTERNASSIAFNWSDVVQVMHLVATILLLLSIIVPWFPRLAKHIPHIVTPVLGIYYARHDASDSRSSNTSPEEKFINEEEKMDALKRLNLLSALSKSRSLSAAEEARTLREALGLGTGILGLTSSLLRQMKLWGKSHSRHALERGMLEQKAFLRLAGLIALDATASVATRMQTYLYAFRFLSVFSASARDLTTLALVVQPFWGSKSASLWALACSRARGEGATNLHIYKAYEVYVLESMTVDEAAGKLTGVMNGSAPNQPGDIEDDDECEFYCPLAVLAKRAIRDCIRTHAENIFVQSVIGDPCKSDGNGDGQDILEERDVSRIATAGRSLDSKTSRLVDIFERVCGPTYAKFASDTRMDYELESSNDSADLDPVDEEIFALLRAIILYRRVFPSALLNGSGCINTDADGRMLGLGHSVSATSAPIPSPPASPSRRDPELHLALRHCLDASAFDRKDVLEDARDRVVDMLTSESNSWPRRLKYV